MNNLQKKTPEVINLILIFKKTLSKNDKLLKDKLQSFIFVLINVSNKNFYSFTEDVFFNLEVALAQLAECLQIGKLLQQT